MNWVVALVVVLLGSSVSMGRVFDLEAHVPDTVGDTQMGDYRSRQGYLDNIQAPYAWGFPGGKGNGISVISLETRLGSVPHVDHPASMGYLTGYEFPTECDGADVERASTSHAVKVTGIIVGVHDDRGIFGIAPEATMKMASQVKPGDCKGRIVQAMTGAIAALQAGDILLIEIGFSGQGPLELAQPLFDLTRAATDSGIVVVASAGNDGLDLTGSTLVGNGGSDSGAILVGASEVLERIKESNYGSRVDVQAQGYRVTTTGGINYSLKQAGLGVGALGYDRGLGDVFPGVFRSLLSREWESQLITGQFDGTSSAGAIVAGASAVLQGIWKERKGEPTAYIPPRCMRRILVQTGTPQRGDSSERIGPLPNLRRAIDEGLVDGDEDGIPALCDCDDSRTADSGFGYPGNLGVGEPIDAFVERDGLMAPCSATPTPTSSPSATPTPTIALTPGPNAVIAENRGGSSGSSAFGRGGEESCGVTCLFVVGQSFQALSTAVIERIFVNVWKQGEVTDGALIKVWLHSGRDEDPRGILLGTSLAIDGVALGTAPAVVLEPTQEFTFDSGVPVVVGEEYFLEILRTGPPDATNFYKIRVFNSYSGGSEYRLIWGDETWSRMITDLQFLITGQAS